MRKIYPKDVYIVYYFGQDRLFVDSRSHCSNNLCIVEMGHRWI